MIFVFWVILALVGATIHRARGDGGFQFENAMADVAIGVVAFLSIWFRGNWWPAALVAISISSWGDAYGHIHQMVAYDNHDPDNTGIVLYSDIVSPLVGLILYGLFRRSGGGQPLRQGNGLPAQPN